MKKFFTLTILMVAAVMSGYSQYYYQLFQTGQNPGNVNQDAEYPLGGGLPAGWTPILGPSVATPTWSATQNLPFNFTFNGVNEIQYKVSSTGILTFDVLGSAAAPGSTPSNLPNASIPNKSVVIWGIDGSGGSDYIVTKTFGTPGSQQHWIFFSSYSIPGNAGAWSYWSIVLEEGTNNIYIVDQRNANGTAAVTLGLQLDAATAIEVAGSPAIGHLAQNAPDATDNAYYAFFPGSRPDNDISLTSIDLPKYLVTGDGPFDITGSFDNLGSLDLTSFNLVYQIDNGTAVSTTVSPVNIPSLDAYTYKHPTPWSPTQGTYMVKVWTEKPNGNPDQNTANDTAMVEVNVIDNFYPRMPLYETFTSATCPPCAPGNTNFHNQLTGKDGEYVSVKYQQNFPGAGDPYGTDEAVNRRRGFYGINAIPALVIDGTFETNSNSFVVDMHESAKAIPSFMDIQVVYEIDEANQRIDYEVEIEALNDFGQVDLYIAILESQTFNNVATNGETEFEQVMKKMLPDENGQRVTVNPSTPVSITDGYTFNGSYRLPSNYASRINHAIEHSVEEFTDLYVVAWAQDPSTNEVFQATVGTEGVKTAIESPQAVERFQIVPNPAQSQANLYFSTTENRDLSIQLLNSMGQHVATVANQTYAAGEHNVYINLSDVAAGVYFVRVMGEGVATTKRIAVVK